MTTLYADNPYGVTSYSYYGDPLKPQLLTDMQTLGMTWLRWQLSWYAIEKTQGVYDWSALDDAVSKANTAQMNFCFPIQDPPNWRLSGIPCDVNTYLPDPQATADFCALVAARYNGSAGHGTIQALQIGNEEYQASGNTNCSHGYQYAPAVLRSVPAIRAAGFTGLIGSAAQSYRDPQDIKGFTQDLYNAGAAQLLDFLDFHYYAAHSPDTAPTGQTTFDQTWQDMHAVCVVNGEQHKPIWFTEFGYQTHASDGSYVVTPQQQASFLIYEIESARVSRCVQKAFIYTMDYGTDTQSITQGTPPTMTYLPAFSAIQQYIQNYPQWETAIYSAPRAAFQWMG